MRYKFKKSLDTQLKDLLSKMSLDGLDDDTKVRGLLFL